MSAVIVKRVEVIGTNVVTYTAWEPGKMHGTHTHITHIGEDCYGDIGCRVLPDAIQSMPSHSSARVAAVRKFFGDSYMEAVTEIIEAFPEVGEGNCLYHIGQITAYEETRWCLADGTKKACVAGEISE